MATMFPARCESFATAGEEAVYRFLEKAARPDGDFLAWYSPDIEDREPDFILLSPDCGLVVLEVKDWLASQILELNPKEALLQIAGRPERRKQPLAQAREYVNSLMHLLGRQPGLSQSQKRELPCPVTWGAVLPHVSREDFRKARLGEVMDEARVLCWDEIGEASPLARDASGGKFRQWLKEHFPPLFPFSLTPGDLAWIRSRIFPVVRLDLPKRAGCPAQAETVLALDQEQENLARRFGAGRTLVQGPSGSGKTLVLAHQAWNLPRMDRRVRRVLVTCFNLSLVPYIRRLLSRKGASLGPDGVEVVPFYTLCERILGEPMAHAESGDFYRLVVEETLERLDGSHPLQGHWDAILVDEGQDFSPGMAEVVLRLLPAHGTLTVALDENQDLYDQGDGAWSAVEGMRTRRLSRQYRSTRQIARAAWKALGEEAPAGGLAYAGADGPEPRRLQAKDGPALVQACAEAVASLVRQGAPMSEIAVLYARSRMPGVESLPQDLVDAVEARGVLARWAARDTASKRAFDITTDSVTVSTVNSAKGLDFAHVILIGLDQLDMAQATARRLAYVGMTRARETLAIAAIAGQ